MLRIGAATAVVTILLLAFLDLASPGFMDPRFGDDIGALALIPVGIGLGLAVVGIVWLRRILQDPEAGPSPWRYHKWD